MPKNADGTKSKMRLKSTRKPLRDVSNAKTAIKSANIYKKISADDGGQAGDDSLDRLLLVHSDLSTLLRQIDELVVQALQLKGNDGRKEIKQFADVLSNMQTSLKPWVSRFQKAVLSQSTGPENKSEQPEALGVSKECTDTAVESPEETKWESLVSPSPLVSWRAGCNTESGRQLFLLTPLPQKKASSSKYQTSSLRAVEKIPSDEVAHPLSLSDSVGNLGNLGNDLYEGVSAKPNPKMAFNIEMTKAAVDNLRTDCASPEKVSNKNCSVFIMTPCMKMSPPKSCMLLEPVSAFSGRKNHVVHRATPFPTGVHSFSESQDSESSSDQSSDDLKLKYPELHGIKKENLHKKMDVEDSPNWIVSPPKTCVIMDPSNEPLLKNRSDNCLLLKTTAVSNQECDFSAIKEKECQGDHATTSKNKLQGIISTLDLAEFTPTIKEPMSSFRMGKHPGENTLKKELWTRFEAASTRGICVNSSLIQNTTKKGFLDILDEASDTYT